MDVHEIDLVKNNSFAVVQLRPGSETKLLRVLLENGYTNVSFTNAIGETVKLVPDDDPAADREIDDLPEEKILVVEEDDHDDEDEDVDVDDSSSTETDPETTKENQENREIIQKEKELLESFYPKKSVIVDPADREVINDENQQRKFLEQLIEQQQQALGKIDPPSPIEFSSLTLPTVLWGAAAVAAANGNEPQSKFPTASFPYNPFLSASVNPFLPYLPTATAPGSAADLIKTGADLPCFPSTAATEAMLSTALWNRNHPHPHHASQQLLDTPPATPRGSGGAGSASSADSHCLITGAKLRQRGRQLRRHERDTSAYASCRLCRNRILANRLSNLHNHVRRHAVLKQFHCCYCSYAHTEVAKVRLHMLHNHKDDRSQPLDKRNDDMEAAWSMLMRECFPGYA